MRCVCMCVVNPIRVVAELPVSEDALLLAGFCQVFSFIGGRLWLHQHKSLLHPGRGQK